MTSCKLWVRSSDGRAFLRADRITSVRVAPLSGAREPDGAQWRLDAVVADPLADGTRVQQLCTGANEDFERNATLWLGRMLAEHLDDANGGTVDCGDLGADDGVELAFSFRAFTDDFQH